MSFFFFNDTATTEIYTLSLHDALPIYLRAAELALDAGRGAVVLVPEIALTPQTVARFRARFGDTVAVRSEEHTSELQSRQYLVCRLLLEKKKQKIHPHMLNYTRAPIYV